MVLTVAVELHIRCAWLWTQRSRHEAYRPPFTRRYLEVKMSAAWLYSVTALELLTRNRVNTLILVSRRYGRDELPACKNGFVGLTEIALQA
jgi:hypothetical protein